MGILRTAAGPRTRAAAIVLAAATAVAACGGSDSGEATGTTAPPTSAADVARSTTSVGGGTTTPTTAAPMQGGTLVVRIEAEVGNAWLPAAMQCDTGCHTRARTFFEPLTAIDATTKTAEPYLAEAVTPNADFTSWTIELRAGVTFSDGTPWDAAAVVANLEAVRASFLLGQEARDITAVTATDASTVTVTMARPWASFDVFLAGQGGYQASPAWLEAVKADPALATEPVGTGPFVLDVYEPAARTVVKRNPTYWRGTEGLPYLDEIEFRIITDARTAQSAMEAGELDVLTTASNEVRYALEDDDRFSLITMQEFGETSYVMLSLAQPGPLQDQRFRCGLSAATDQAALEKLAGVRPDDAETLRANGLFSPGQQGYLADNGHQSHDLARAKELIAEYVAATGGSRPRIVYTTSQDATSSATAEALQAMWGDAGVDVEILPLEQSTFINNALLGDPSFQAMGFRLHGGITVDEQYKWWHSTNAAPAGSLALNFTRMKDPVIDENLDKAHTSADPAVRRAAAEAVNRRMAEQCYSIPFSWVRWSIFSRTDVLGLGTATFPGGAGALLDGTPLPGTLWWQNVSRS